MNCNTTVAGPNLKINRFLFNPQMVAHSSVNVPTSSEKAALLSEEDGDHLEDQYCESQEGASSSEETKSFSIEQYGLHIILQRFENSVAPWPIIF